MQFWESGIVLTALALAVLLLAGELIRGLFPALRRYGIPASILAGTLGFLLGSSVSGVLPLDTAFLEAAVYHGLAIVFIAVSLETPEKGRSAGAVAMSFGIPAMMAMQTFVGLAVILVLGMLTEPQHPGFGLMLPMGFQQGPGQALSMGQAWEVSGMRDGAQVGLIVAALGFGVSVFVGVPLVAYGRARGWVSDEHEHAEHAAHVHVDRTLPPGAVELLTRQLVMIGVCYLATYGIVSWLSAQFANAGMADLAAMAWGFHFIFGALVAMPLRGLLNRGPIESPLDDELLGRISAVVVDVITCAALAAVQLQVFTANWVVIVAVSLAGTITTVIACVWLAFRAFPSEPFEHCVVWFGMLTGTLPMGLALLRIIDPELRSSAPVSAVLGSAGAIPGAVPIMMVMIPMTVERWPEGYPNAGWMMLGLVGAYGLAVMVAWWMFGGLRLTRSDPAPG